VRPPSTTEVAIDRQRETACFIARDLRILLRLTDPDLARRIGEIEEELVKRRLDFSANLNGDEGETQ
jgi:hypothetical protein